MTAPPAYRIDGRPASRDQFYAAACDPGRSVVVEACAGAGKTWMLVSRILRALLAGALPHEILAITFTRKAAGEMRERLGSWLRQFADASPGAREAELRHRGLSAAEATQLEPALRTLHDRLLATGRPVEVRTFHAWFSQLLRGAPWDLLAELGLQPEMTLIEDLDELRPELFRRFHAAVLADEALLADFRALSARRGRFMLRRWLESAWARRTEIELADAAGHLDGGMPDASEFHPELEGRAPAAMVRVAPLASLLDRLACELGALGKATPVQAAQALRDALMMTDDEEALQAVLVALFTEKGNGAPRKKMGDLPLCEDVCARLERLRDARHQQIAQEEHGCMARLARALLREYAALKRGRALVDMDDLERVAHALLADSELAGWVQQRLDARVRHLLIDEFQDTSPLQWHTLQAWLAGYAGAGGGQAPPAVFIVGDPKQSIYRFRRAEPRVFAAARDFVVEALGGTVLECDHTRRNAPGIVAAINALFGQLHGEGRFEGWRDHTTEVPGYGGELLALPSVERPAKAAQAAEPAPRWRDSLTEPRREAETVLREAEARTVALAIGELVARGHACGEIQVLSRKRASLRLVAAALQALGLPCVEPEQNLLIERPEVRDLLAVVDVLASPGHDLSLAQALRSPLFGADDALLLALSRAAGGPGGWWAALMAGHGEGEAAERARGLLARWAQAARELPPHDLLDRIVHEGDLMARLAAVVPAARRASALDAVRSLLAQSLQLDGGRYATPYGFVRALRQRAAKSSIVLPGDAVQLLTVHGAKGLEARSVFIVDADPEPPSPEQATVLVDWPVDEARPLRVAFLASESRCPPALRPLVESERAARQREELNTWYVAMTRAIDRLVVSRTPPSRASATPPLWSHLQPLATPWDVAAATAALATESAAGGPAVPALAEFDLPVIAPPMRARPVRETSRIAGPTTPGDAARLGTATHRALEWVMAGTPLETAATAAAVAGSVPAAAVRAMAERMLSSPQCARFFHGPLRWAGNEVTVSEGGEALRIDRLVCLDSGAGSEWWVLDYKIEREPEQVDAYRQQIARYRRAVQALQPGEAVRAAFIAGDGRLVEILD